MLISNLPHWSMRAPWDKGRFYFIFLHVWHMLPFFAPEFVNNWCQLVSHPGYIGAQFIREQEVCLYLKLVYWHSAGDSANTYPTHRNELNHHQMLNFYISFEPPIYTMSSATLKPKDWHQFGYEIWAVYIYTWPDYWSLMAASTLELYYLQSLVEGQMDILV